MDESRRGSVPGLPGEETVAALRAELNDIRSDLDHVGQGLAGVGAGPDQPTGSPPPESTSPRRRRALVVGALLMTCALGVLGLRAALSPSAPSDAAIDGGRPTSRASVPGGLTGGPGAGGPGTVVVARPSAADSLVVQEWAVLPAPVRTITLSVPDPASVPTSLLQTPTVTDLEVTSDGTPLNLTPSVDGWTARSDDERPLTRLALAYTLEGAVTGRGDAGRALFVVTPLTAETSHAAGAPVLVRVGDAQVLQAACLGAPVGEQLCGSVGADGWTARIPASSSVPFVMFQVDVGE